jgi:uncharacterized protein (DUF2236 family)
MTYAQLVQPLTPDELDAYCDEASSVAVELGARPDTVPRTWDGLQSYLAAMYGSGTIAVGAQARELADAVLAPPFAPLVAPFAFANRVLTVGLLPEPIRRQYGFEWTPRDERRLQLIRGGATKLRRLLPRRLALWPEAL